MAIFDSGNPTFSQKIFDKSLSLEAGNTGVMSVRGAINKFGFLLVLIIASASYVWGLYYQANTSTTYTLMLVGLFGGFIVAIVTSFKPLWAQYLAPAYALLEGLALGGLSAIVNDQFHEKYPGLIIQAVGLTFGIAIAMFLLYNFRIIKATERLKSIIFTASLGIAVFYLIDVILFYVFNIDVPITSWQNTSLISIGFSLFVIVIAALRLIIDLGRIEEGAEMGLPKFMEWYGAFGLTVTIVWLYIEVLKLLSRLTKRN